MRIRNCTLCDLGTCRNPGIPSNGKRLVKRRLLPAARNRSRQSHAISGGLREPKAAPTCTSSGKLLAPIGLVRSSLSNGVLPLPSCSQIKLWCVRYLRSAVLSDLMVKRLQSVLTGVSYVMVLLIECSLGPTSLFALFAIDHVSRGFD